MTKIAIQELDWEVLPHPPYSPDLVPSNFHLFRSLSNALRGVSFNNKEEVKICLMNSLSPNPLIFTAEELKKLVKRWEEVVNSYGEYIVD